MRTMLMLGLLATAGAVACGEGGGSAGGPPAGSPPAAAAPAGSTTAAAATTHDVRGRIEAIGADRRTVTLDHEEIPGVMAAMKMEYQVRAPAILEGLSVGDRVQGQIEVRSGDQYVVIRLRK